MYFIPLALFIKAGAPPAFWAALGASAADYAALTWRGFFISNLLPVTLGNLIGGVGLVGVVYWFVYRRSLGR
jgi:formate transporter